MKFLAYNISYLYTFKKIKKTKCPLPGLNQRPQDLQSYALPAELNGLQLFNKNL